MADAVLVTGGAGYVGSHICKALAEAGFVPVSFDSLERGNRWAVQWGPLEVGDVADPASLDDALAAHRPVAVVHCAAYADVGESVEHPTRYYRNNVVGTLNLLGRMLERGPTAVVFSSSCAVYGVPDEVPIPVSHPLRPVNPYGVTKFMVERMLAAFQAGHGFRWAALRYFNAAGADPDGDIGESHDPETRLIPRALDAALGALPELDIFGVDYPTPDGTAVRDYVHVTDIAEAHVAAVRALLAGRERMALNLGTGTGHSVRDVIAAVERVTGAAVPVREGPRRPGDPPVLVADASETERALDWRPRHLALERIVETAWRWHQNRPSA